MYLCFNADILFPLEPGRCAGPLPERAVQQLRQALHPRALHRHGEEGMDEGGTYTAAQTHVYVLF